jgi:hypothetical protein
MTNIITRFQADPTPNNPLQVQVYYAREIVVEGETIRIPVSAPLTISEQSGGVIAEAFTAFMDVLNTEINSIEPTPTIPKPDWGNFNRAMYANSAYARARAVTSNQDAKITIESLVVALGIAEKDLAQQDYLFFQLQWNQLISALSISDRPTALEINDWNAIASATNMPFQFDNQGYVALTGEP